MNARYFACPKCGLSIDAGYRWAYWQIEESERLHLAEGVDVRAFLTFDEYWLPPEHERSTWLCEDILPAARNFLSKHEFHGVVYIEEEHLSAEETLLYNWKEVEPQRRTCE